MNNTNYPKQKYYYEKLSNLQFLEHQKRLCEIPKIICLCGSTKFINEFRQKNLELTLQGVIVLSIGCDIKTDNEFSFTSEIKQKLDELHKRKIDLADEIFVLNIGGYIGESTKSEIEYAIKWNKPVKFCEPHNVKIDLPETENEHKERTLAGRGNV